MATIYQINVTLIGSKPPIWQHLLTLEKILPKEKGTNYPICIKGKGNCPPENCGGIRGFTELLATIKDKDQLQHMTKLEWLGEDYDPQHFDWEEINKWLRQAILSSL